MEENISPDRLFNVYKDKQEKIFVDNVLGPLSDVFSEYIPDPSPIMSSILDILGGSRPHSLYGARPLIQMVGGAVYLDRVSDQILGVDENRVVDSISDDTLYTYINGGIGYVGVEVADTELNNRYLRKLGFTISIGEDSIVGALMLNPVADSISYDYLIEWAPKIPSIVKAFRTITRRLDRCNNTWRDLPKFQNM